MPSDADRVRLDDKIIAIQHQLTALTGPDGARLVRRLDALTGDAEVATENRVLRLVGAVLLEHDLADLFEEIFARVRVDSHIEPGAARRFLFRIPPDA